MAVKTTLYQQDLEQMLSHYDLGELVDFSPISSGNVQTNYYVTTTQCKAVLRLYENRTYNSADYAYYERALTHHLRANDFPCAAIYPTRDGDVHLYQGKPYLLFEFCNGAHVESPNDAQYANLIELIARLGHLTKGLRLPYESVRLNYHPATCARLAREIADQIGTDNAKRKLEWYMHELDNLVLPDDMTMAVCHSDFHFTNVLYDGDDIVALIDFDDANYTYLLFDIIAATECFVPAFNHDTWQNFAPAADLIDTEALRRNMNLYRQHIELSETDMRYAFDVLKLSIFIDCLWFYERGAYTDFYERRKIDALDALGREQFTKAVFDSYC